jgi:hypothetical protein
LPTVLALVPTVGVLRSNPKLSPLAGRVWLEPCAGPPDHVITTGLSCYSQGYDGINTGLSQAGSVSRAQAVPPHIQTLLDAADDARACLDAPPASDTTTSGGSIATGLLSGSGARKPSASQARPRTSMLPGGGRRASIDGGEDLRSSITTMQQVRVPLSLPWCTSCVRSQGLSRRPCSKITLRY